MASQFNLDLIYVEARRVLLDALTALAPHGAGIVVAGAQAVYLRTGGANIAIAPYTTDADLALDPSRLGIDPALDVAMTGAGFKLSDEPGVWIAETEIDGVPASGSRRPKSTASRRLSPSI
jgi:hypothetical protein